MHTVRTEWLFLLELRFSAVHYEEGSPVRCLSKPDGADSILPDAVPGIERRPLHRVLWHFWTERQTAIQLLAAGTQRDERNLRAMIHPINIHSLSSYI